jgi:hypothetical protein
MCDGDAGQRGGTQKIVGAVHAVRARALPGPALHCQRSPDLQCRSATRLVVHTRRQSNYNPVIHLCCSARTSRHRNTWRRRAWCRRRLRLISLGVPLVVSSAGNRAVTRQKHSSSAQTQIVQRCRQYRWHMYS